jgi:imidazolonepropionase-like amidohydrolase
MVKAFVIALGLLLPAGVLCQSTRNQTLDRIWITNVRIISPEKLDHIDEGSVLIEDGRIVRVERRRGAKRPAGANVVSGADQFLIPGLIDSHVHLALIPGMSDDQAAANPGIVEQYFRQLPRCYVYYGPMPTVATSELALPN